MLGECAPLLWVDGRCAEGKRNLGDVLEEGVADALAKRAAQAFSHCP